MNQFPEVFSSLKAILEPYATSMVVHKNEPEYFFLNTGLNREDGYPWFFASVQIKKNYVSYHLMAMYTNPELVGEMSEGLKKRLQGKSCFNFKKLEPELVAELAKITARGLEKLKEKGMA